MSEKEPGKMACVTHARAMRHAPRTVDFIWEHQSVSQRDAWIAVEAAIRADQREKDAQVGRKAVMHFRNRIKGRYYTGYHEDMREHVAAAIRQGDTP